MFAGLALLLCLCGTQASILFKPARTRTDLESNVADNSLSYQDIKDNLILDEDNIGQDLFPPKPSAKDYYNYQRKENPVQTPSFDKDTEYVIDTVDKVLRLNAEEGSQEKKLRPVEETEMKKLSAAFAQLFGDSKSDNYDGDGQTQAELPKAMEERDASEPMTSDEENPTPTSPVSLSNTGMSVTFANLSEPVESNLTETSNFAAERDHLLVSIVRSVSEALAAVLDRGLNTADQHNCSTDSSDSTTEVVAVTPALEDEEHEYKELGKLTKFLKNVRNMMKSSIRYIASLFSHVADKNDKPVEEDAINDSTTAETESNTPPTTTTMAVITIDRRSSFHKLPSEEFRKRGRDVDSLYYGFGIV